MKTKLDKNGNPIYHNPTNLALGSNVYMEQSSAWLIRRRMTIKAKQGIKISEQVITNINSILILKRGNDVDAFY